MRKEDDPVDPRLIARIEEDRPHLRAVAYRMLGSLAEADDAVQDACIRAAQADSTDVENLTGWLTTIVTRVCLNQLRSRQTRREEPLETEDRNPAFAIAEEHDPEHEAVLADSVGVALLVVLDTLAPAERVAFVLHDLFAVPFDEIAPMIEKSPAATRQLASRARRRVQGRTPPADPGFTRRRAIVDAFLNATRAGDFDALLALLDPDVVLHADRMVVPTPEPITVRGANPVAKGAMAAVGRARFTGPALLDGAIGLAMAPHGRLAVLLTFAITDDRITAIDVIAEPDRLQAVELAVLDV